MKVKIRPATHDDLEEIRHIFNYYILNTPDIYDENPRSSQYMEQWWKSKQSKSFPILIAENEKGMLGFASYGEFRRWEAYSTSAEHSLYLKSELRHKGIGSRLMKALIRQAKLQGLHCLIGGINAENTLSIAFHRKFGFKEVARIPEVAFKNGKWLDLLLMQKIL